MDILTHAIRTATEAHLGQVYGDGPYILHPLRVMGAVFEETGDAELAAAAVLHDAVEDSRLTLGQLYELGFSERIVSAVDGVTKREGETYMERIERAARNADARTIKLHDLADNMAHDPGAKLMKRYERATRYLKAAELLAEE